MGMVSQLKVSPIYNTLECGADVIVQKGGTSSGKTYTILQWLAVVACGERLSDTDPIITVVGSTIPNLKVGAYRQFKSIIDHEAFKPYISKVSVVDRTWEFRSGNVIEFKSYANEQEAKSGKRQLLFINECNGVPFEVYRQLSLRTKQTILDYNPSEDFWVDTEIFAKAEQMKRDGIKIARFTTNYQHNPFLDPRTIRTIESYKDDPHMWAVYGLGMNAVNPDRIYTDVSKVISFPTANPKQYYYGLDFGGSLTDPMALVRCFEWDQNLYVEELIYDYKCDITELDGLMKDIGLQKNIVIYADHSPTNQSELRRKGWQIINAKKGENSIISQINRARDFFYQTACLCVYPFCKPPIPLSDLRCLFSQLPIYSPALYDLFGI